MIYMPKVNITNEAFKHTKIGGCNTGNKDRTYNMTAYVSPNSRSNSAMIPLPACRRTSCMPHRTMGRCESKVQVVTPPHWENDQPRKFMSKFKVHTGLVYLSQTSYPRSAWLVKYDQPVYPDELTVSNCWQVWPWITLWHWRNSFSWGCWNFGWACTHASLACLVSQWPTVAAKLFLTDQSVG